MDSIYKSLLTKCCYHCHAIKPVEQFYKNRSIKGGFSGECKLCANDTHKRYFIKKYGTLKRAKKHNHLRCRYGISLEEFNRLVKVQDGVCAICHKPESKNRALSVDHNHITGIVRQLLCSNCNKAIGLFNENTDIMRNAITYLDTHNISNN